MNNPKISLKELQTIFGSFIPLEAIELLTQTDPNKSIDQLREQLQQLAVTHQIPIKDVVRTKFAKLSREEGRPITASEVDQGLWDDSTAMNVMVTVVTEIVKKFKKKPILDEEGYLWKWVERGLFDKTQTARGCLGVIAHHPSAPWENGRWDVSHKPYAEAFYEAFPKARSK